MAGELSDNQIKHILRTKSPNFGSRPSDLPRYRRKNKLKVRFQGRLGSEIAKTQEKLDLLRELLREEF